VRIVGGRFRGRPLAAPTHEGTRPTSDRVREAIFNILAHGAAEVELEGARVLDLFAGTGALGLEALSRGALFCLFVEHDAQARALTRRNIEALGPAGKNSGFTLAFLDPPYGQGLAERALASAAEGGWLAPGAVAVIEERKGTELVLPGSYAAFDQRTWGDTQALFARFRPDRG